VLLHRDESYVTVEVLDTGKGIAPDFLHRVFDRFTQHESSNSRSAGGLGLGLAIVKHLVELHGGSVAVRSDGANAGSTFAVKLPLAAVRTTRAEANVADSSSDDMTCPPELAGLSVLVVDDEADARELVYAVLHRAKAAVTLASSAIEALAMIKQHKPDIIVSDIGMPETDGYAFITRLRSLPREEGGRIPAVALTAYARADDRRRALLAGFQNHAAKPIEPQELMIVIANLAGRYA
jgi:CheY-like chemotaxis protein